MPWPYPDVSQRLSPPTAVPASDRGASASDSPYDADLLRTLARERERLAVALRTGGFGVYEWRLADSRVWWSPETFPIYGVDPSRFEPTVESFAALIHPDDRDEVWRRTQDSLAQREVFVHEYRIVRPDGAVRWIANRSHIALDARGEVEGIIGVAVDITERKLAEVALRDAEARLRIATQAGNIGIWEWDVVADAVVWSDRVYALHDLQPGTFGGRAADFLELVEPADRDGVAGRLQAALRDGTGFTAEFRTVLPDGGRRWLSTSAWIHRDARGVPTRMTGATISVDPYKRVEETLRDVDRRKDEFLATLSHELRNPLAPVRTAVRVLQRETLAAPGRTALTLVDRQVAHLVRLVDDLLDMSRITQGTLSLRRERMALDRALRDAAEAIEPLVRERGHALRLDLAGEKIEVDADPVRIAQILENLLVNACRYTDAGGRIALRCRRDGAVAAIEVADSGRGFSTDELPRLFEPFVRLDRADEGTRDGLGIGLSLVRHLATLHDGEVRASSPGPGLGATFEVRLPIAAPRGPAG